MSDPVSLYDQFLKVDGDSYTFDVVRGEIEKGRTFSPEAIAELAENMTAYIMSRVIRRWDATNEPPTALSVNLSVEAR